MIKFQKETANTIFTNRQMETTEMLIWNQFIAFIFLKKKGRITFFSISEFSAKTLPSGFQQQESNIHTH